MAINFKIQSFDNQTPANLLKTINIHNAVALPMVGHILNIDLQDYIVKEVRHRVAYQTQAVTDDRGIQQSFQEMDGIVVIAYKKGDDATYSLK